MSRQFEQKKSQSAGEEEYQMTPRYKERIRLKSPVRFRTDSHVATGQVIDLTIPGCLIDSPVAVHKAQSLQLEIFLPGLPVPLSVSLGVVRWTKGRQFGVEFIKMHESQQLILNRFLAQHFSDMTGLAELSERSDVNRSYKRP